MADIFAHGHLCQTTHPFWQHFETFHVLSQPCYQGKYPPGPPLFMALGQVVTGFPIAGVWISLAVMIMAVGYAMYAWLPSRWALLGTALVTLRFGVGVDWAHSYWGGTVAAAGGALVLGSVKWLTARPTARDGAALGFGLVLLALSRPYEGLAYSLSPMVFLAWRLCQPWPGRGRLWRAGLPSAAVVIAAGIGWLGYYNWRVTGFPTTLPYAVYERAYSATPLFVWQESRSPGPVFRHQEMARFEREFTIAGSARTRAGWPRQKLIVLGAALRFFYLTPLLLLAGVGLIFTRSLWRASLPAATVFLPAASLATVLAASSVAMWSASGRYLAPATVSIFLLVTVGLAGLSHRRLGPLRSWMAAAVAVIVIVYAASVLLMAARHAIDLRTSTAWWTAKRDIREQLLRTDGADLVFVRYVPSHSTFQEWVYNGSDIDQQPIVWAREIDPESDARLRAYFGQRKAWVVEADEAPPRLMSWQRRERE
ncbi:MAG: hypothetical protein HOP16_11895 [Acidobacteria bacterium]|nr:hypothetical protein [Acidobacteriota bacterium]